MDVLPVPCPQRSVSKLWQLSVRKRMEQAALNSSGQQAVGRGPTGAALSSGPDGSGCVATTAADARGRSYSGGGAAAPPPLVVASTGGGLSKEKKGPSWTSMLILPQPEVSQAMAATAQAMGPVTGSGSGGHHHLAHDGGCPSGASGGSTGRVTRPRSRLTSSTSGLQPPERWGTRGGNGGKGAGSQGKAFLGSDADFLTAGTGFGAFGQPAWPGAAPPAGPGGLPGWCLDPLGDADLMLMGSAEYEDALLSGPSADFDVVNLAMEAPCRPASAPPAAMQPPPHGLGGPLELLPQLSRTLLHCSDSTFTSLDAQVAQLQQEVAREAACLLATAAAAKQQCGAAEQLQSGLTSAVDVTTTAWTADGTSGGGDGSSSPNTSGSAAGSSATLAFGPIGLKLRKSESLLNLVAARCSASVEAASAEALALPAGGADAVPTAV